MSGHLNEMTPILRTASLEKVYRSGDDRLVLFENLNLEIACGQMVAIVGQSGAGKSTLLHLLGALDRPTKGSVFFEDVELSSLSEPEAAAFRNREAGYVWQFHYLLPEFTALENVAMPLLMRGLRRAEALEKATSWLAEVGLSGRAQHRAGELSGGEQQRISLARALVGSPRLLLADEPTGDLDHRTAEAIFGLIQRLHREHGLTSVLVTHNLDFARRCDRVLVLREGAVREEAPQAVGGLAD
jgi:lipoprotein-releasing system ATP-binding protein